MVPLSPVTKILEGYGVALGEFTSLATVRAPVLQNVEPVTVVALFTS